MSKIPSRILNLSGEDDASFVTVEKSESAADTCLTSDSEILSSLKQKEDLQPPTGPSLMLSDPSIPKSTSAYSSSPTTGARPGINSDIWIGRSHTVSPPLLEKSFPLAGLPYAEMTNHRHPRALDSQIGGSHYKDFNVQPIEFIHKNNIGFIAGNVIKYVCRYAAKDGIKDLEKARHYIDILIEQERNETNKT